MKKLFLIIMFLIVFIGIDVKADDNTCTYANGLKITRAADEGFGWALMDSGNYSSYDGNIRFASNSEHRAWESCPGVLYIACNGNECILGEEQSMVDNFGSMEALNLQTSSVDSEINTIIPDDYIDTSGPNYNTTIPSISGNDEKCPAIFGDANDENSILGYMNKYIFTPIRYITPVIFLLLTSLDFAKAVFSGEQDSMKKAQGNFGKRAVAAILVFLAPTVVTILLNLVDFMGCLGSGNLNGL